MGEQYEHLSVWDEAVRWYGEAGKAPGMIGGIANLRSARILRDRLGRGPEAAALFRSACEAGSVEACRETGEKPPDRPLDPLRRKRGAPRN